jgi:hypothetical protein
MSAGIWLLKHSSALVYSIALKVVLFAVNAPIKETFEGK